MRTTSLALMLAGGLGLAGTHALATGGARPGRGAAEDRSLGRCPVFPRDNPWNQDISREPVDPDSDRLMAAMNAGKKHLHPDFGSDPRYGIPWIAVPGTQPRLPITFKWPDESDPGPYPFPPHAPIEGGPDATGDRHVLVVERSSCTLYEGCNCRLEGGAWRCDSGAMFNLRSNKVRPEGWTSADAAGLPIFAGLVRLDEVARGEITHALRFTVARPQKAYVFPARHCAGDHRDPGLPPFGLRVRLKADYDLSGVTGAPKVILTALKKYGMFLADIGADWFITGESNPAWDDDELGQLKRVPASAFEVVKLGRVCR